MDFFSSGFDMILGFLNEVATSIATFIGFITSSETMIGFIIGLLIISPFIFWVLCYKFFAPKNIFFTFGRENKAVYVMNGKKFSGRVILPSKTLYVDVKDNYNIKAFADLPSDYPENLKESLKQKSFLGMYWVGIYPFYSIHERRQQWLEWKSTEGGKREIILRDEMTPYLIVKPFEYAMLLEEGEDSKGVPLNAYFTVTLKPTNALLPIFGNDNAYGQVQTKCLSEVLLFTKEKTFSNLGGDNISSDIKNDEFSLLLCKLNETIPGKEKGSGIIKILGYEIEDAKLDKVEIGGDKKEELLEASTVTYVAEEKAKAKIAEAEGNLKVAQLEAQGLKTKLDVEREYYEKIANLPGVVEIEKRKATPLLTTLVEDVTKSNLLLGGGK